MSGDAQLVALKATTHRQAVRIEQLEAALRDAVDWIETFAAGSRRPPKDGRVVIANGNATLAAAGGNRDAVDGDLSMMIRRLVARVRKFDGHDAIASQAMILLTKHGTQGSITSDAESAPFLFPVMKICQVCGNKRCPHAEDQKWKCTGSNNLDQARQLRGKPCTCGESPWPCSRESGCKLGDLWYCRKQYKEWP